MQPKDMEAQNRTALRKDRTEEEENDELHYLIYSLPSKFLTEINLRHHITEEKEPDAIREAILDLETDKLSEILAEYAEAGSVTCFIYVFDENTAKVIKERTERVIDELRGSIQDLSRSRPLVAKKVESVPEHNEIWLQAISIGKYSFYKFFNEDSKKEQLDIQRKRHVDTIAVRILIDKGLMAIRTSDQALADKVKNMILDAIGGTAEIIEFSKEDVQAILKWAAKIRGANFRLTHDISSLSMTAGKDKIRGTARSLTDVDDFWHYVQEGKLVGVYIHISQRDGETAIPDEDAKPQLEEDYIGFRINFLIAKIFFKTALSETEIRQRVKEVLDNVEIRRPAPSTIRRLYEFIGSRRDSNP